MRRGEVRGGEGRSGRSCLLARASFARGHGWKGKLLTITEITGNTERYLGEGEQTSASLERYITSLEQLKNANVARKIHVSSAASAHEAVVPLARPMLGVEDSITYRRLRARSCLRHRGRAVCRPTSSRTSGKQRSRGARSGRSGRRTPASGHSKGPPWRRRRRVGVRLC